VNGILGVARAFGDFELEDYITCVPDVFRVDAAEIEAGNYIVAACDGLWDVMEDSVVCFAIRFFVLFRCVCSSEDLLFWFWFWFSSFY
jgi:serine/threonine protein phosphatase PrpC